MNGERAPRLDGYYKAFFQPCWSIIKEDTVWVFQVFHEQGTFEKSLNSTFIALTPKKPNPVNAKDF